MIKMESAVLDRLAVMCFKNSFRHGFWDDEACALQALEESPSAYSESAEAYVTLATKGLKLSLIHSEITEVLEGIRKPGKDSRYELRIGEALFAKMEYNASRPYKHGREC